METTQSSSETQVLLHDDFNGSAVSTSSWHFNVWQPVNNPSYYGRTQIRQALPEVSEGVLHLQLDTYNPTGFSFYGSEIISNEYFSRDTGIAFEARARLVAPAECGLVGGIFAYEFQNASAHDEITFELLSNDAVAGRSRVLTNAYDEQPLVAGDFQFVSAGAGVTAYHTYRIELLPNSVHWFIDGNLVRVETETVPDDPMQLHLNLWAPGQEMPDGYCSGLQPIGSAGANRSFFFEVDYARVVRLGTSSNQGTPGDDVLISGAGNDTLDGGDGVDVALYSGAFRQYTLSGNPTGTATISGPDGADSLSSIENLAFVDGKLTFDDNDHMAQAYRLYFATLGRAPDALGLNFQSARLDAGTSLTDVAAGFVNSPEFQATYGSLDDAQFVNLLYQNVLDRSAAPSEIAFHVARLQSGASRSDVVVGFSEAPEHIQKHSGAVNAGLWDIDESMASVARLYFGMLERTPETSGLAFYAQQFANGLTVQQVANGFAASPEFLAKYGPLDDSAYVRQLYANILQRSAGADEVAFHVNRLAAGATRGDVAAGFTEAPEYQVKTLAFVDDGIAVADAGFVLT